MMIVDVREVQGRRELKEYINLPARIHKNHANWIPPIYMDDRRYFDARKNRSFTWSDTTLALAWNDGGPVGRIMGIINRRYNELRDERVGRFGYLECPEDHEVFTALLTHVENWARRHGMTCILGPLGFSDQDAEGFMVEGFDEEPVLAAYQNFPWMPRFMEQAGYEKDMDYVHYLIPVPDRLPPLYEKVSRRLLRQREFRLVEFTRKSDLKRWIRRIFELMNDTYRDLYGYVPLDRQEMKDLAAQYLPVLDPRFVKLVAKEDELVAFIIGMPNINEGLRRCHGHILPFGIFQIKAAMKRTKQLALYLGAIREDCRGRGLDVLLGAAQLRSAMERGLERIDSHHEMETNLKVRAEMERVGGRIFKRSRVYRKTL